MWKKTEILPGVIGLSLVFGFGLGLEGLLGATEREWYPVVAMELIDGVDQSYGGEYAQELRFRALLEDLPKMRLQALHAAQVRTGLSSEDPAAYVVRFKDTLEFGASSRPVRAEHGDVFLVTLAAKHAVFGTMDVRASLIHEFIHCLMRERLGSMTYRALPGWIREGLAVWGAGQIPERVRSLTAGTLRSFEGPVVSLAGIEDHWLRTDDYLLDALTFEFLAQAHGESAVRLFIGRLAQGSQPSESFSEVTGASWIELLTERRRFARFWVEAEVARSGLVEFALAERERRSGNATGSLAWLGRLIRERSDSLLVPNAWYWAGRLFEDAELPARAVVAYSAVADRYGFHEGLQADARRRLSLCRLGLVPDVP